MSVPEDFDNSKVRFMSTDKKLRFVCPLILMLSLISVPLNYGESEIRDEKKKSNSAPSLIPVGIKNSSSADRIDKSVKNKINSDIEKAVIIIYDGGHRSQFTNAKPVLDKYGFKASFFVICSYIDGNGYYKLSKGKDTFKDLVNAMSWNQLRELDKQGHDIESHGMQHRYLKNLTSEDLEHEVSGSKECLVDHGLEPTYFQVPNNRGADNSTILNVISKYFDFALAGHSELMFLNCDGWVNHGYKTKSYKYQYDCNPYSDDGTLTRTHKFTIKEWSHDRYHNTVNNKYPLLHHFGDEISNMLFTEFVRIVEAQKQYNNNAGKIVAVPIIGYHAIGNYSTFGTPIELFDREMKYLYDNGFKVLKLTDLGHNEKEHYFYIK